MGELRRKLGGYKMILQIDSIHEMYEIKRALKKTLNDRNKAIQEMEEYQEKLIATNTSWDIVNGVGKVIAGFKLDAKTELELIRQINRQIDKCEDVNIKTGEEECI